MKPETQEWIEKAEGDRKVDRSHIKSDFNVARFNQFLRRYDNAFKRCTDSSL